MPSRKQVKQAAKLLGASEGGLLRVPDHLVDAILLMHREPYASLNALSKGSTPVRNWQLTRDFHPRCQKGASESVHCKPFLFFIFLQEITKMFSRREV